LAKPTAEQVRELGTMSLALQQEVEEARASLGITGLPSLSNASTGRERSKPQAAKQEEPKIRVNRLSGGAKSNRRKSNGCGGVSFCRVDN